MNRERYELVEGGINIVGFKTPQGDESELFLDATAVRRSVDNETRERNTRRILEILDETGIGGRVHTREQEERPNLSEDIGFTRRGYGVFGMTAEILWPNLSDKEATHEATQAMRAMAHNLGTYSDEEMPLYVAAEVNRSYGITLETNPVGSCSMDTDGSEYAYQLSEGGTERVTLHAHNLYTHEMQLICISGLIALTRG